MRQWTIRAAVMLLLLLVRRLSSCQCRCLCLLALCLVSYQRQWIYITWEEAAGEARRDPALLLQQQLQRQHKEKVPKKIFDEASAEQRIEQLQRLEAELRRLRRSRSVGVGSGCYGKVPLLLHQTYAGASLPELYRRPVASCLEANRDFAYVLWTDDDAVRFVEEKYPSYAHLFKSYRKPLQKSDALRYFILHYYGGVYADMDVQCIRSFAELAANESCFLDQERREQSQILYGIPYSAMNSVMGCCKRHPFMESVLQSLPRYKHGSDILRSTGPLFLTEVFKNFQGRAPSLRGRLRLLSPEVFSPLLDNPEFFRSTCARWSRLPTYFHLHPRFKLRLAACRQLQRAGFRQSAGRWLTNSTIGVHRFLHLGYARSSIRRLVRFDLKKVLPELRVLRYTKDAKEIEELSHRCYD